jgi:hypothetical protein
MKKTILTLFLLLSNTVFAKDWDSSQHNFKFESGNFKGEIRNKIRSFKDHLQLTYKGITNFDLDYRYTDDLTPENRFRVTYKGFTNGTLYINPRFEYRSFKGDNNDYYRLRAVAGIQYYVRSTRMWLELQPSWNIEQSDKKNDLKIDSSQLRVGFDYKLDNKLFLGPFIQYEMNNAWQKTDIFLGTNLTLKF